MPYTLVQCFYIFQIPLVRWHHPQVSRQTSLSQNTTSESGENFSNGVWLYHYHLISQKSLLPLKIKNVCCQLNWADINSLKRSLLVDTVYIWKPDCPAFEWPSLGHFLDPAFEWWNRPSCFDSRTEGFLTSSLDRLVFEWSFFGHYLCPVFEWSAILFWRPSCFGSHLVFSIRKPDPFVRFSNGQN